MNNLEAAQAISAAQAADASAIVLLDAKLRVRELNNTCPKYSRIVQRQYTLAKPAHWTITQVALYNKHLAGMVARRRAKNEETRRAEEVQVRFDIARRAQKRADRLQAEARFASACGV